MKYRLIAFDLDGTLLNDDKKIPERNLLALKAAAERGCYIVPATGRIVAGMPEDIRRLDCVRYYVIMNGAMVWDEADKTVIRRSEMDLETALKLYEYLDGFPVGYDCYKDGRGYISADDFRLLNEYFEAIPKMIGYVRSIRTAVPDLKATLRDWGESIQKMQIYFRPCQEELRKQMLSELPEKFPELAFTSSLKNNIEVNSCDAGKDKGLQALCSVLGLDMASVVAFGDGSNDSAMLAAAGLGVCMDNGCAEAKAAADEICDDNNRAGLAQVIERLIEQNQI